MKYKIILSSLILTLMIAACSSTVNEQIPETISNASETVRSVSRPTEIGGTVESSDTRGYIFFAPLRSTTTYLIDFDGDVVHTWSSQYTPGNSVYLLEDGNLLRTGTVDNSTFDSGGAGGIVQEMDWNGNVLWQFQYSNSNYLMHHDVELLPGGNILMIVWEYRTAAEAVALGRDPNQLKENALWPDMLIEVDPSTDQIVWEWHVWDHLVQNYDPTKPNYGNPSDHVDLININYAPVNHADWTHINAVDYNPELDQILLSVHGFSEIWIIDHSTSTAEAASHSGGKSGKGGDLLYRWGNPQGYDGGNESDQQLFLQHDAQWVVSGLPGEGNILIFNNGDRRSRPYSSVEEITPPLGVDGNYVRSVVAYGPASSTWTYEAHPVTDFYARNISGVQRLPDGNTLICNGPSGEFFEVTPAGNIIWNYVNPFGESNSINTGSENRVQNPVFRAVYYPADYVGLAGHDISE